MLQVKAKQGEKIIRKIYSKEKSYFYLPFLPLSLRQDELYNSCYLRNPTFINWPQKVASGHLKPALKFITTSSIIFIPVHAVADPKCGVKVTFVIFNNGWSSAEALVRSRRALRLLSLHSSMRQSNHHGWQFLHVQYWPVLLLVSLGRAPLLISCGSFLM